MLSTTAITTLNLLIGEDVVDHIVNVHFVTDGGSNYAEIIDEVLKNFPCLAFREDWMQGPDVIPEQSLRHGEGNGSTSVDPMKPSGHGWGCPASERQRCRHEHSPLGGGRCIQEGLDM